MTTRPTSLPVTRDLTLVTWFSAIIAGLLVIVSVSGLLFGWRGLYTPDPRTLPTFLGQDALSLLVGLPLLLGSMWLARHGSLHGLLLWLGALFYLAYSYAYYVLAPEFNVLYPAYLALVSLSLYGLLYLLLSTDAEAVRARFGERTPTRLIGGFLIVMGLLPAAVWVGMIVADLSAGTTPSRVNQVVWPLDLVVAFPALVWGGLWLWRRQPLGYVVAGLLLVKAAVLGLTLVLNSWLVTRWGVPLDPMLPFYATVGLGGLALAVIYLRGIEAPTHPAGEQPPASHSDALTTLSVTNP